MIKICGACPDLTKTIWNNIKPYLEPRWTKKWLKTAQFSKNLVRELQPSCIEFCIEDMNATQVCSHYLHIQIKCPRF